jgi:molybdopterin-containing oxidoreductase family iron-sulfur binding subunit
MEDWNDYEYIDGSISLMQPVMNPLYDTKSAGDIFLSLMDESTAFKEKVRTNWLKWNGIGEISNDQEIERFYAGKLRKGVLERKTKISIDLKLKQIGKPPKTIKLASEEKFFLKASPSLFFYDGHLSDRPWLQEIPHVTSNISWQSWADINKTKAESLNISEGDIIELKNEDRAIQVPAHLCENIHPDVINIEIGQGRKYIYDDVKGVNAYLLSSPLHRLNTSSVTIKKTGTHKQLLKLHPTKDQHSRKLLKYTPKDHLESANFKKEDIRLPLPEGYKKDQDLYPPHEHDTYRWAMVIDLQKCIGCKACEAACYAENNIPVVGEKSCYDGLEMSWLKVIPYKTENNKLAYLPQPCQHCDAAPCEPVCPVFASVHNEEGLNAQIYNRCIGTRYCSNNCPYKVRRFNWKNIKHEYPMNLQLNPEVTVRERGVMEKCTFCIQRINNAKHQALKEEREIKDGEVTPACAQTCPTEAIVFGNLMDENSKVSKLIDHKRRYQLLGKLNTKPAVIYLKKVMLNNKI